MPPATVTHQVVPRALARAAQVAQRDAEDAGAEDAVRVAGKPSAVQCPVERAGMQAVVGAHRTRGRQAGADVKSRVLRMHAGHRCKDGYRTRGHKVSLKSWYCSMHQSSHKTVILSPASPFFSQIRLNKTQIVTGLRKQEVQTGNLTDTDTGDSFCKRYTINLTVSTLIYRFYFFSH